MNVYDTRHKNYDEAEALEELLMGCRQALDDDIEHYSLTDCWTGQFTVNIAGKSIAFLAGGPQIEALINFVRHIDAENLHGIDVDAYLK